MLNSNGMDYTGMLDCYMQRGQWISGECIKRHDRETDTNYARRKSLVCSPALYRQMIDTYDVMFSQEPKRYFTDAEGKSVSFDYPIWTAFSYDCGMGLSLNKFLNMGQKLSSVLGSVYIVMDVDKIQPTSADDAIKQRTYPYCFIVLPQDVESIVVDMVGRIKKFCYKYKKWDEENTGAIYYREFDGENETISRDVKEDGITRREFVESNSMNMIPVIPFVVSQEPLQTSTLPSSPTSGLYQIQRNIVNTISMVDENVSKSQFPTLVLLSDKANGEIKVGNNSALGLNPGDDAKFISPEATAADVMKAWIDKMIELMKLTFANMLTSGEQQSGTAKMIDRQVGAMQLKNQAAYLEEIEYKIYEMFCLYVPSEYNEGYTVEYFKEFDLAEISDIIANAQSAIDAGISDSNKVEVRKQIIKSIFPNRSIEDIRALLESEDMNTEPAPGNADTVV